VHSFLEEALEFEVDVKEALRESAKFTLDFMRVLPSLLAPDPQYWGTA
jgi:hypothetical protein